MFGNDPLDIYNTTSADIVCANGTVPTGSYLSIAAADAPAWAKDPIVRVNVLDDSLGVAVYGVDLGTGQGSAADTWLQRVAGANIVY